MILCIRIYLIFNPLSIIMLKKIIRQSHFYRKLELWNEFKKTTSSGFWQEYKNWGATNFAAPSPHFVKQEVLLRNALSNATWVETGTYLGQTTEKLSKHGSFVYSIEPEPTLFANAARKFKSFSNVKILNGLSEEILPSLLEQLSGKVNFWLDGHYSYDVTHKGPQDTPILDELASISKNLQRLDQFCIMIDDLRCFNPTYEIYSNYPKLKTLINWVDQHNLYWHIEHDILVASSEPTQPPPSI